MTRATLDAFHAERLCKLLGMLGSDHAGERAVAGRMAHELVKRLELTWEQIIVPRLPAPELERWLEPVTAEEAIELAVAHLNLLNEWESRFVWELHRKHVWRLSDKQNDKLSDIIEKIRQYREAA